MCRLAKLAFAILLAALPASAQFAFGETGAVGVAPPAATVTVCGGGTKNGNNSAAGITWTLGCTVPTGNLAVFAIGVNQGFAPVSGVPSDNNGASDTWQCDQDLISGSALEMCSAVASAGITSVTWNSGGSSGQYGAFLAYATPVLTTAWADVGNKGTASTTALTVTATAAATTNDIAFAAFMASSTSDPTLTIQTAGYTAILSDANLVTNRYYTVGWKTASAGSTPSAQSHTTITVGQWGVLEAYKE